MFYSLLDIIACPACKTELTLLCPQVKIQPTTMKLWYTRHTGSNGGRAPQMHAHSDLRQLLAAYLAAPVEDEPNDSRYITDAVLVCLQCRRWFPVRDGLPELLPDHLRDWDDDQNWLVSHRDRFEALGLVEVFNILCQYIHIKSAPAEDQGSKYKIAEMGITKRNLPEGFFGPAAVAPFQPLRPEYSIDLLLRFATTVQRLECGVNAFILDLGVGYAWTTEWLVRLGYRAIGIDISRDYLLAGLPRMGSFLPHLIVGDVENLPMLNTSFDAVLSFDSFHHIPNRNQAMRELDRVMKAGAKIALVEPGKQHEHDPLSIAVMQQHGILEVGFNQDDLKSYVSNTSLRNIVHHRTDAHPHDIFTVQKNGVYVPTSSSPRKLLAGIELDPNTGSTDAMTPVDLHLSISNLGDTTWLCAAPENRGAVRVGANLYDSNRSLIKENYLEIILPQSINPGERINLICTIPPIHEPGDYIVEFDLLIVGMLRFKDFHYNVKDWRYSIRENAGSSQKTKASQDPASPIFIQPGDWKVTQFKPRDPDLASGAIRALREGGPMLLFRKAKSYITSKLRS